MSVNTSHPSSLALVPGPSSFGFDKCGSDAATQRLISKSWFVFARPLVEQVPEATQLRRTQLLILDEMGQQK
jgi:hypothetical protein